MNLEAINSIEFLIAAKAEKCKRSFYYFVQEFWEIIIPETPIWNWHIKYLCDELQEIGWRVKARQPKLYDYYIINVPPGSSKSTIVSEMYVAWIWAIDPTQRFMCGSYASTPAEDIAEKCKQIVESEKYISYFGNVLQSNAKTNLKTKKNGQRMTTTVGGSATGIHAHQIIIDDPLNPKQASSDTERETANNWMSQTLSTRKVDREVTVTILVMQRLHELDPTGYLLAKKGLKIKHICIPAQLPKEAENNVFPAELRANYIDGLMDPIRLSASVITTMRVDMGSYASAGQLDQKPADLSNGIVKKHWLTIVDREQKGVVKKFVFDTAYTSDDGNDPCGFLAYFVEDGKLYITNWEHHNLEFPQLVKHTNNFVKRNGYSDRSIIRVEPKASGKSLVQQVKAENASLNITEDVNPEKDKKARLVSITAKLESGKVFLLRDSWNNDFITEVCTFPRAAHDEAVDCLVMAVRAELMKKDNSDWTLYI